MNIGSVLGGLTLTVLAVLIGPSDNPVFCTTANNNQHSSSSTTQTSMPFCNFITNMGKGLLGVSFWIDYKQILIGGIV
jgi:hypothetical protein